LNAKGESGQGFVAVEHVKPTAASKAALRHRKSPCWRRDLAEECGQKWQTFSLSEKSVYPVNQEAKPDFFVEP
jgi:hypothetical protein